MGPSQGVTVWTQPPACGVLHRSAKPPPAVLYTTAHCSMPQHRAAQLEGKCPTFSRLSRFSWPLSARSSVLLPAPGGPSSSVRRPGRSTEDTPCRMGTFRRRLPGLARCRQGDEQIKCRVGGTGQVAAMQATGEAVRCPHTACMHDQPQECHQISPEQPLACATVFTRSIRLVACCSSVCSDGRCPATSAVTLRFLHQWQGRWKSSQPLVGVTAGRQPLRAGSATACGSVHLSNTVTLQPQSRERPMHRLSHSHAPTVSLHAAMSPQTQLT